MRKEIFEEGLVVVRFLRSAIDALGMYNRATQMRHHDWTPLEAEGERNNRAVITDVKGDKSAHGWSRTIISSDHKFA